MPPVFVTTADAVDRETAWLTAVDTLPPLLVGDGGRWDVVQAYQPRTPAQRKNQIWVLRRYARMERFALVRKIPKYQFYLRCWWTLSNSAGSAEADQRAFDAAVNDVLIRVNGLGEPGADKTHGGKFMAVAEDPGMVEAVFVPPDTTLMPSAAFAAEITYWADDPDFTM